MNSSTSQQVKILRDDEIVILPEPLSLTARFTGLNAWMNFVHKVYQFPVYRLVCNMNDQVGGWLALTHTQHRVFGNYLVTSPFGSYGGFAYASAEARDALLERAQALTNDLGVEYVNVRFEAGNETPPIGWIQHPIYSTYLVDLVQTPDAILGGFGSDHRNHIHKSLKQGFSIKFGHLDLLDDIYEVLAQSMHELGSPYHHKNYLRNMAEALGHSLEFVVTYSP